jgi:hypothetical protein
LDVALVLFVTEAELELRFNNSSYVA